MSYSLLTNYFSSVSSPLNLEELFNICSENKENYLFIKNRNSKYEYANDAFSKLMGLDNSRQIISKTDFELCANNKLAKQYIEDDNQVFEEGKSLSLFNVVNPKSSSLVISMQGMLYPLCMHSERADYVLGIVSPVRRVSSLTWETVFNLSSMEFSQLLIKKNYAIDSKFGLIRFSIREIQVLFELLHGKHAGEIGQSLNLKQTTVESYLINIKNKIGVSSKSEIISFIISSKLFHQIL